MASSAKDTWRSRSRTPRSRPGRRRWPRGPGIGRRLKDCLPPGPVDRGRAAQRHGPEHRAAALRAARGLQRGDARPPAARPDLVHGRAAGAPVGPEDRGPAVGGVQRPVVRPRRSAAGRPPCCAGGTGGWCRPGCPRPRYSLKFGVSDRTASPSARSAWTGSVWSGRRAPNEKNTCRPGSGASASTARDRNSSAPATVYGGSVQATSNPSARPPGSGWRRSCSTRSTPTPLRAVCSPTQPSTSGSVSTTASRRITSAARSGGEGHDGHRHQVVVAEQQDPLAGQRVRLVHGAAPGASWCRRCSASGPARAWPRAPRRRAVQPARPAAATRRGIDDPAARAGRAGGDPGPAGRPSPPRRPAGGQPHRPGTVHDAALAQLVADRGDDGHRQLGHLADLAHRDGLGAARSRAARPGRRTLPRPGPQPPRPRP